MNWVLISNEKCNGCGLCLTRCTGCFSHKNGQILVKANQDTCNMCGHCISLCPTDAITHQMMDMSNFPPVDTNVIPNSMIFTKFIRQRRSHRHFKKKPIRKKDLETLIDICRYAPTGSNRQGVEIKVIQNPERVKYLSELSINYFIDIIKQIESQVEQIEKEGKPLPNDLDFLYSNTKRYKPFIMDRESGTDVIFRKAPCVMIFHSSSQSSTTPKDDCVIAAHTVSMLAITLGIQTCFIGLFTAAANAHPPIMNALSLPPDNSVHSVLILGYAKLNFLRAVDRKPIKVTWE